MARKPNTEQQDVKLPRKGKPKLHDWGDGKGKVHSRAKKDRPAGGTPPVPPSGPPPYMLGPLNQAGVNREAERAGDLRYGGVENQLAQQQANIPSWFDAYKQTLQSAGEASQQAYDPIIEQSRQTAQASSQPVLSAQGVDPNSEAAQNDALAAASRKALGDLATQMFIANQATDQSYFKARGGVAEAGRVGALTENATQTRETARERGTYQQGYASDVTERERAYGLAREHQTVENKAFGLDVAEEVNDQKAEGNKVNQYGVKESTWAKWGRERRKKWIAEFNKDTAKPPAPKAPGEPKYGVNADQWAKMTPAQRKVAKDRWESGGGGTNGGMTPAQRRAARTESRKVVGRIEDNVIPLWEQYRNENVTEDLGGGRTRSRKPTPSEIKTRLRRDGYSAAEIHLALMIRGNKPLTPADIRAARRMGIRKIPKSWRRRKAPAEAPPRQGHGGPAGP